MRPACAERIVCHVLRAPPHWHSQARTHDMDQRTRLFSDAGRHACLLTDPYNGSTETLLERFIRFIRLLKVSQEQQHRRVSIQARPCHTGPLNPPPPPPPRAASLGQAACWSVLKQALVHASAPLQRHTHTCNFAVWYTPSLLSPRCAT